MDEELKSKLLMGLSINTCGLTIRNYTIGEIFKYGLNKHRHLIGLSVMKPKDILENPNNDDIKDLEIYDFICIFEPLRKWFIDMIFYLSGHTFQYNEVFGEFFDLLENGKKLIIGKNECNEIFDIVKKMYCLSESKKESDRTDIDDEMRELLREFEEEEEKVRKAKGKDITMLSIIEGVSIKHNSLNLTNIWSYTTYQLMRTYYKICQIDNENRVVQGVYAGTIDSKGIDFEKINWANNI